MSLRPLGEGAIAELGLDGRDARRKFSEQTITIEEAIDPRLIARRKDGFVLCDREFLAPRRFEGEGIPLTEEDLERDALAGDDDLLFEARRRDRAHRV